MPLTNICDATGKPIPEGEEEIVGWGKLRMYGKEGLQSYKAYESDLRFAAKQAREVYEYLRANALANFQDVHPDGKLPDTPDENDDEK